MTASIERPQLNSASLRLRSREMARVFLGRAGQVMTGSCLALSAVALAGGSTQVPAIATGVAAGALLLTAAHDRSRFALVDLTERFAEAVKTVRELAPAQRSAVLVGTAGAVSLAIVMTIMQSFPTPVAAPAVPEMVTMLGGEKASADRAYEMALGKFVVTGFETSDVEILRMLEREGYGLAEGADGQAWVFATQAQLERLKGVVQDGFGKITSVEKGQEFFSAADQPAEVKQALAVWVSSASAFKSVMSPELSQAVKDWSDAAPGP